MSTQGVDSRLCVYFDMNVWVEMARGVHAAESRWEQVVHDLRAAAGAGLIVIPLSASHYLELWHRRSKESRESVGAIMRDLSLYATLAPIQRIRELEVAAAVDRFAGLAPTVVGRSEVLASGANHAFDSEFGRFRFVERLETEKDAEGPAVPAPEEFGRLNLRGPNWEWLQLVGTQEIVEKDGVDRTPEHRLGNRYAAQELGLRSKLEDDPARRRRLADIIVTQEIVDLTEQINSACVERRTDPHGVFLGNADFDDPPTAMRAFVAAMPSVQVLATLRLWKHRDLTHPWEQHDKGDLIALSAAIPYCDAVVTERRWAHLAKAARLTSGFGTTVGCGLQAIEELLQRLDGAG